MENSKTSRCAIWGWIQSGEKFKKAATDEICGGLKIFDRAAVSKKKCTDVKNRPPTDNF